MGWESQGANDAHVGDGAVAFHDQQKSRAAEVLRKANGSFFLCVVDETASGGLRVVAALRAPEAETKDEQMKATRWFFQGVRSAALQGIKKARELTQETGQ